MLQVFFYLVFSILGITLVKMGGSNVVFDISMAKLHFEMKLLTMFGLLSYVVSFILFINIIPRYDLSYITPLTIGITQVAIILISYFVFKESLTLPRILGIVIIVAGVFLLNVKN